MSSVNQLVTAAISGANTPETILESAMMTLIFEFRKLIGPSSQQAAAFVVHDTSVRSSTPSTCVDIVGSQLLFEFASAVLNNQPSGVVAAEAKMVRAIDCSGNRSALAVNSALAAALDRSVARYAADRQPLVKRALLTAYANLVVLVLDTTNSVGDTDLREWLITNRRGIAEVFAEPGSLSRSTGLWIRETGANRLVQLNRLCEDGLAPPCVSISHLLDAMIDPRRQAFQNCSLGEAFGPTLDPTVGYLCQRDICAPPAENGANGADGLTPLGETVSSLQTTRCPAGSNGNGTSWSSAGGGLVGVGGGIAGNVVGCGTDPLVTGPDMKPWACADMLTTAPDPLVMSTEWIEPSTASRFCQPSLADGPTVDPDKKKDFVKKAGDAAAAKLEADKKENEDKAKKANVTISDAEYQKGIDAVKGAKKVTVASDALMDDDKKNSEFCKSRSACTVGDKILIRDSYVANQLASGDTSGAADLLAHEASHIIVANAGLGNSPQQDEFIWDNWRYASKRRHLLCEDPARCMEGCNSLTAAAKATKDCLDQRVWEMRSPGRTVIRPPKNVAHPAPIDTPSSADWQPCFGGIAKVPLQCTALDCGISGAAAATPACTCRTRSSVGVASRSTCAWVTNCPSGAPIADANGICRCSTPGSDALPPAPLPPRSGPGEVYP